MTEEFPLRKVDYIPIIGYFTSTSRIREQIYAKPDPDAYFAQHKAELTDKNFFLPAYHLLSTAALLGALEIILK